MKDKRLVQNGGYLFMLVTACTTTPTPVTEPTPPSDYPWKFPTIPECTRSYGAFPTTTGSLSDDELVETSGLVASPIQPGVFFAHNDSGDSARFFAFTVDGVPHGRYRLRDIEVADVEAIAVAPCPDGASACVFLADTGDNLKARNDAAVYVARVPAVPIDASVDSFDVAAVWTIPIVWPNEPVDVEAFVVTSDGNTMWFLEKTNGDVSRWFSATAPFENDEVVTPIHSFDVEKFGVGALDKGTMITAADLHPSGNRLLVRVYTGVYEFVLDEKNDLASIGEPTLIALGPLDEPQGEAIGYTESGLSFITISEDLASAPGQAIHWFECE